ncbi:MAG TPA: hypothetical protein VHE32_10895, partial [Rhodanobacteraceae bacterium]|nr:hypothetical protein [Rhodanobacteraceae bacterium]
MKVIEHGRSSVCARPSGNRAILEDQRYVQSEIFARGSIGRWRMCRSAWLDHAIEVQKCGLHRIRRR